MVTQEGTTQGVASSATNKRRRIGLACCSCRARKSRCDGIRPACTLCKELGFECSYVAQTSSSNVIVGKEYFSFLESRLEQVESSLGVANTKIRDLTNKVFGESHVSPYDGTEHLDFEDDTGKEPLERDAVDGMGAVTFEVEEESAYFGPSSNIAFLRQVALAVARRGNFSGPWTPPVSAPVLEGGFVSISRPASPVAPRHSLGLAISPKLNLFALPPESETVSLINVYFSDTGRLFPYVHKETFLETYTEMRKRNLTKIRRNWLGLLNMILAIATSAHVDPVFSAKERMAKSDVFYQRALGLCQKRIMRGASLEIVQCLLIMVQYLQGTQKSAEAWIMHGITIQAALALGLHCHSASSKMSPLECEVRKRTWYGCVLLDRTLSMTFGRPFSIPESNVDLTLPQPFPTELSAGDGSFPDESLDVQFFVVTIKLYRVMGQVIESLYGQNRTSQESKSTDQIVVHLFRIQQQLTEWEQALPMTLRLVTPEDVAMMTSERLSAPDPNQILAERLRNILTLRYLNLRLLLHRPIITLFLDQCDNSPVVNQDVKFLRQFGQNSLQVCVESANLVIAIVHGSMQNDCRPQHKLLGAWWFSLYYTFNAAIVVVACFLASGQIEGELVSRLLNAESVFAKMRQATLALAKLDNSNHMVERCRHYLEQLTRVIEKIDRGGQPDSFNRDFSGHWTDPVTEAFPNEAGQQSFDLDLGEFLMDSDFMFLSHQLQPNESGAIPFNRATPRQM